MFAVNEILVLSRDSSLANSLVVEVCGNYAKELEGFYVLLPKTSYEAVKAYIKSIPQNSFILRTFDDNAINGLSLLLNYERGKSYTEEFIKTYGGVQNLLASFASKPEKVEHPVTENTTQVDDFIDTSIFADSINPMDTVDNVSVDPPTEILCSQEPEQIIEPAQDASKPHFKVFGEDTSQVVPQETVESPAEGMLGEDMNDTVETSTQVDNRDLQYSSYDYTQAEAYNQYYTTQQAYNYVDNSQQNYNNQDIQQGYTDYSQQYYGGYTQMPVPYEMYRQQEEFYALLQGIANSLGVNQYNENTLEKADMYNAQLAINSLQAELVKNAFIGALGLAESRNDMASITRFLELFYSYLYETGLQ